MTAIRGFPNDFAERDIGVEPTTFSLGRSRPPSQRLARLSNRATTLSFSPVHDPIPPSV
jgi:hypothetical protein